MIGEGAPVPLVRRRDPRAWAAAGGIIGVLGFFIGSTLVPHEWLHRWGLSWMLGLLAVPLAAAVIARVLEEIVVRGKARAEVQQWRAVVTPAPTIAQASEGPIEIRGTIHVIEPVESPFTGQRCAAYAHRQTEHRTDESGDRYESAILLASAVGSIEVRDDSGAVAYLAAAPCEVNREPGDDSADEYFQEGDAVLVSGIGRWEMLPGDGGYRTAQRRLVIAGDETVVLKLRADAERRSGVRVAVDAATAASDADEADARDDEGGTKGHRAAKS
jgi:hypothetical protein